MQWSVLCTSFVFIWVSCRHMYHNFELLSYSLFIISVKKAIQNFFKSKCKLNSALNIIISLVYFCSISAFF